MIIGAHQNSRKGLIHMGFEPVEGCEPFFLNDSWVSPLNFHPEVRSKMNLPSKVLIHDVTLRDGEQMAGVVFTEDEKVAIALELDKLGIPLIEIGTPAVSEEDQRAFKRLAKMKLKAKKIALARIMEEDVKLAAECGADGLFYETSINPYFVKHVLGLDSNEFIQRIIKGAKLAKELGLFVEFCGWDTFRINNLEWIKTVYTELLRNVEVDQIGISDTLGQAHPFTVNFLVRKMKEWFPSVPLAVHVHNDYGLATATALMAIASGAEAVETSFNCLGERTGNAATEEVVMGVEMILGIKTGIDCSGLYRVSKLIQEISKVRVAPNKPIVGDRIFHSESGIVIDANEKLRKATGFEYCMFPYNPKLTNRDVKYVAGKKSGRAYVRHFLERQGIMATEAQVDEILIRIKKQGIVLKNFLPDEEVKRIVESVLGK